MNSTFSNDWSREEKEKFAAQKMMEMELKNQKLKQRHAEVERDRLEAEKSCAAVTSVKTIPLKPPPTKDCNEIEDSSWSQTKQRAEREWDIGKKADGDWDIPKQKDYKTTWNPRSGGHSDGRRYRREPNRRSEGFSRKDNYRPSDISRRSENLKVRHQDSNQRGQSNFYNETSNNFPISNNKTNTGSKWKEDGKKQFSGAPSQSAFPNQNPFPKPLAKIDHDKVWHDDGLNEAQNKQSRVAKWVKSISRVEKWSENEDKPTKSFTNVNKSEDTSDFHNKHIYTDEEEEDIGVKRQIFFKNRGTARCRPIHKSSYREQFYSSETYKSTNLNRQETSKSNVRDRSNNQQTRFINDDQKKSYFEKQSDLHIYGRPKPNKSKFNQRSTNYNTSKNSGFKSKAGIKQYNYNKSKDSEYSGTCSDEKYDFRPDKNIPKNKGGTWNDDSDNQRDKIIYEDKSGTWDDVCVMQQDKIIDENKSGTWNDDCDNQPVQTIYENRSGTWNDDCDNQPVQTIYENKSGTWDNQKYNQSDRNAYKHKSEIRSHERYDYQLPITSYEKKTDTEAVNYKNIDNVSKTNSKFIEAKEIAEQTNKSMKEFYGKQWDKKIDSKRDYLNNHDKNAKVFKTKSFQDKTNCHKNLGKKESGTWSSLESDDEDSGGKDCNWTSEWVADDKTVKENINQDTTKSLNNIETNITHIYESPSNVDLTVTENVVEKSKEDIYVLENQENLKTDKVQETKDTDKQSDENIIDILNVSQSVQKENETYDEINIQSTNNIINENYNYDLEQENENSPNLEEFQKSARDILTSDKSAGQKPFKSGDPNNISEKNISDCCNSVVESRSDSNVDSLKFTIVNNDKTDLKCIDISNEKKISEDQPILSKISESMCSSSLEISQNVVEIHTNLSAQTTNSFNISDEINTIPTALNKSGDGDPSTITD